MASFRSCALWSRLGENFTCSESCQRGPVPPPAQPCHPRPHPSGRSPCPHHHPQSLATLLPVPLTPSSWRTMGAHVPCMPQAPWCLRVLRTLACGGHYPAHRQWWKQTIAGERECSSSWSSRSWTRQASRDFERPTQQSLRGCKFPRPGTPTIQT